MNDYYTLIDKSPLLNFLFYPRKDFVSGPGNSFDLAVRVQENIHVSCRFFYNEDFNCPWILYFHGNGEVVSDYNEIAPMYNSEKINIVVADYRGYGRSSGLPSFSALIKDAPILFESIQEELFNKGYTDKLWLMGRSLGSISALELAYSFPEKIHGLIIESGFLSPVRLLKHLGLPSFGLNLNLLEQEAINKVGSISLPTLIIHGEQDTLVPLKEGKELLRQMGSKQKEIEIIPGADHNNIMFVGQKQYFSAIRQFLYKSDYGLLNS